MSSELRSIALTLPCVAVVLRGRRELKMATSKTKSVSAFFEPSKRLRVDAGANAALVSGIDPSSDSPHERTKMGGGSEKSRNVSTTARESDGVDLHPLPGFEPPPFRGVKQHTALEETEEASTVQEVKETAPAPEVTREQKMRMELNKTVARAKRNLRACEEHIAESQSTLRFTILSIQ